MGHFVRSASQWFFVFAFLASSIVVLSSVVFGLPALLLMVGFALLLPCFGVSVVIGWPLFFQCVWIVMAFRALQFLLARNHEVHLDADRQLEIQQKLALQCEGTNDKMVGSCIPFFVVDESGRPHIIPGQRGRAGDIVT